MTSFARQPQTIQNAHLTSATRTEVRAGAVRVARETTPTWGNQALQRLLRAGAIQAKLTVNQPGDAYEQEADRVADHVMRMPGTQAVPHIQRMCPDCEEELHRQSMEEEEEEETLQAKQIPGHTPEVTSAGQAQVNSLRGGGQPLPESVRAFFEPRFGYDFSRVRVHADARAADSAQAVNARAYTLGRDIVFGSGQFVPGTSAGQRLLAHELTHVVQQSERRATPALQRWSYGAGTHNTSGGNTLREVAAAERSGPNGVDAAMAIVDRLVTGTDGRARACQQWFTDNCLDPRTLANLHLRATIWIWRRADGSRGLGLTDGGDGRHHAVTEQLFDNHSRWALAATILHEYWHDCDTGAPADIGDDAKAACGLPDI